MIQDTNCPTGASVEISKPMIVEPSSDRFGLRRVRKRFIVGSLLLTASALSFLPQVRAGSPAPVYDVIIRNGELFDGSGAASRVADVAVRGDRIVAIADHISGPAKVEIDARGKAVAPGFINMLAHPEESLIADGRALSDLRQGVTLEVLGEDSMGPVNARMKALMPARQADIKYPVNWNTLSEYLEMLEHKGIAPNIASFVGAGTVRNYVLGEADVQPTPEQVSAMQQLVREQMEGGALGLTDALIYSPNTYAKTPELIALAKVSAQCGGMYIAHIRSEGDRLEQAVQETFDIARASGAPAEIYHFKQAGRDNWGKFDTVVRMIEAERAKGVRITADMYTYTAGATGFDAAMPSWVQSGGLEDWITRLKDPAIRARVASEMRNPHPGTWENLYAGASAEGTLLLAFKNPALKPLAGKTLAEVAKMRGKSPEETAMDLVVEDGSRVGVAYFLMSEENVQRGITLPWMSFGSDEAAPAPEGVFLLAHNHPRAYGNFARLLGHYVREKRVISLTEAIRRLTSLPADNLSLRERGRLKTGYFADIVVFDPKTISDHATFADAAQLATGVDDVLVNGAFALRNGKPTGGATGRVVRGRAWTGAPGGGCRKSPSEWTWSK
ncbi:MAG: D-aminoacylase [Pseudomonadota bacterium]|jgi:N-acyl-D-amino-acid deacylase